MICRLLVALLFLCSSVALAAPRPLTLDDLQRLREVSDPQVSPDGEWVAYTVRTADLASDKNDRDVWMTSWDGTKTLQLTRGTGSQATPRWSPDGRYLAFLSDRDDENELTQLWLLPRTGEAEKITAFPGGVTDYDWAPDGKRLVLVVEDPDPDAEAKAKKSGEGKEKTKRPIVIDRFQFKLDESGYLGPRHSHLVLWNLDTRASEPLTSGSFEELQPAWSPDGATIAFVSKRGDDPDRTDNWDVYAIEPRAGATPRRLTTYEGSDNAPDFGSPLAWSPDGKTLAYVQGGPDNLIYYALHRLAVVSAAGGPARVLTPDLDRNVLAPRFSPDGRTLFFTLEEDGDVGLARVSLSGGAIERVVTGQRTVSSTSMARNGRLAVLISTPSAPAEVYAVEGKEPRRITRQNDAWLSEVRLGETERTSFRSKDGAEIHGFLVHPPDDSGRPPRPDQPGRRYPTILRIHGGPVGQFESSFDFDHQLLAAHGYVVLAANPRGSSGRGEAFQRAIWADWGHRDAEDVLAAVDDAVRRGIADPERLAVGGWSYGGMLTNYVIAQDRRFKAATSGAGISNILAGYGTDQYVREYEQELGVPWKNLDAWLKVSFPFLHADRIATPTLFLCGESDFNVPLINSEQMYQALRSLGVPTQLVIYPGQHHGIRKPTYVRDRLERYVAWYDRYTTGGAAPSNASAPASH